VVLSCVLSLSRVFFFFFFSGLSRVELDLQYRTDTMRAEAKQ